MYVMPKLPRMPARGLQRWRADPACQGQRTVTVDALRQGRRKKEGGGRSEALVLLMMRYECILESFMA